MGEHDEKRTGEGLFKNCPRGPHLCALNGAEVRGHMGQEWPQDAELILRCLRHVWGCPTAPFACTHPLHATATRIVTALDG